MEGGVIIAGSCLRDSSGLLSALVPPLPPPLASLSDQGPRAE
jgi:hypothetical protein